MLCVNVVLNRKSLVKEDWIEHSNPKYYYYYFLPWYFILSILKQVAQLSQRDRAAGWGYGQKWKTGTGRQYLREYIGLYSTTAAYLASKEIEIGEKTPNKGYYAVQGHPRSSRSVPIESLYATSYYWGLRDNVRCSPWAHWKVRSGLLISDNWTFIAIAVTAEALQAKIGDFAPARSHWPKNFV